MNWLVKRTLQREKDSAVEMFDKVRQRVKDGEPFRWTGDARVLWPDDTVTRYKTMRGARQAARKRGYRTRFCAELEDEFAAIITDVWVERWYK